MKDLFVCKEEFCPIELEGRLVGEKYDVDVEVLGKESPDLRENHSEPRLHSRHESLRW